VSESFPELARAVLEHAQPGRIDIVRANRQLLGQQGAAAEALTDVVQGARQPTKSRRL
jgi:hypothetical protein